MFQGESMADGNTEPPKLGSKRIKQIFTQTAAPKGASDPALDVIRQLAGVDVADPIPTPSLNEVTLSSQARGKMDLSKDTKAEADVFGSFGTLGIEYVQDHQRYRISFSELKRDQEDSKPHGLVVDNEDGMTRLASKTEARAMLDKMKADLSPADKQKYAQELKAAEKEIPLLPDVAEPFPPVPDPKSHHGFGQYIRAFAQPVHYEGPDYSKDMKTFVAHDYVKDGKPDSVISQHDGKRYAINLHKPEDKYKDDVLFKPFVVQDSSGAREATPAEARAMLAKAKSELSPADLKDVGADLKSLEKGLPHETKPAKKPAAVKPS
jgi:hypothetical protein